MQPIRRLAALVAASALTVACGGAPAPAADPLVPPAAAPQDHAAREAAARAAFDEAFMLRLDGRELEAVDAFRALAARSPDTRAGAAAVYATEHSMALTGLVAVSAAVAVPAYQKYLRQAQIAEATENLDRLVMAAMSHYETPGGGPKGKPLPKRLPASAPVTPAASRGIGGKPNPITADAAMFDHATWRALGFAPEGQLRFRYSFTVSTEAGRPKFEAVAVGDPDCDGVASTFLRIGRVNAEGQIELEYRDGPDGLGE